MRRLAFAFLLLAIAALVGCGKSKTKTDKTNPEKSNGKSPVVGNGKQPTAALKDKVAGKWKSTIEADDEKLKKMLTAQKVPADKLDEAIKKSRASMPAMSMEVDVKPDGTYQLTATGMGPKPKVTTGKWEVVSEEGDVLKLKTTEDGGEKSETITLTFKGDDEYAFVTDDPEFKQAPIKIPLTFKRVKE